MCWTYDFVRNQNWLHLISLFGIRGWPLPLGTAWPTKGAAHLEAGPSTKSPQLSKSKISASKYTCRMSFDVMYAAFVRLIAFMY